jgi:hypothetical protein
MARKRQVGRHSMVALKTLIFSERGRESPGFSRGMNRPRRCITTLDEQMF